MFLLKPRWLVLHACALGLAVLFVNFGFWQLRRLDERQTRNALLESRFQQEALPLDLLLASFKLDVPASHEASILLRSAFVTGVYDATEEVLFRSANNYDGQPGYYVLTPLLLEEGKAMLVKRGWVPFEFKTTPVQEALPVTSEVMLEGMLLEPSSRPTGFLSNLTPRDPEGELVITAYFDTVRLAEQMPYELLPLVLDLRVQTPPQTTVLPLPNKELELSEGSHLGYAVQWFSFALIGVVGYGVLMFGLVKEHNKVVT